MAEQYNVSIFLELADKLSKPAKAATASLKGLDTTIKKVDTAPVESRFKTLMGKLDGMGREFKKFGMDLTGDVTLPIVAFSGFALKSAIDLDRLRHTLDISGASFNSLRQMAVRTGVPFSELSDIFLQAQRAGYVSLTSLQKLGEKGIPVIEELSKRFGVSTKDIEHMAAVGIISAEDLDEALKKLTADTGAMNLAKSYDILKESMSSAFADIGTDIADTIDLKGIFISLSEKVRQLAAWFHNLSDGQRKVIITILGVMAAMGPTIVIVGKMMEYVSVFGTVLSKFGSILFKMGPILRIFGSIGLKAFQMLAVGLRVVAVAAMANPIILVIMAIIAAAALIYKYWEPIKKFFIDFWTKFKKPIMVVIGMIFGFALALVAAALLIYKYWEPIKSFFSNLWDSITQGFMSAVETIKIQINKLIKKLSFGFLPSVFDVKTAPIKGAVSNINRNENSNEVVIKVQSDKGTTSTIEGVKRTKGSSNVKVSNRTGLGRTAPAL